MKSQINLLQGELVPKFEWVCASHFSGLCVLVTLICASAYGFTLYSHQQTQHQADVLGKKISNEQRSVDELSKAITQRITDPLLESKLANFKEQTRDRSQLLNHIRNLSALKQRSFSSMFDSLSQSQNNELWLTNFEVTPTQLHLQGLISKPRALPMWISQLSKTDFFKGQEFNVASVEREQDNLVFTLNSKQKSAELKNDSALAKTEVSR